MSIINKRAQKEEDENNNTYLTPYKIDSFNKLLKTIIKTQRKSRHIVVPLSLDTKPSLTRSKTFRCIEDICKNIEENCHVKPKNIEEDKVINIDIDVEINCISDLLKLTESYKLDKNIQYNIDMKKLHSIKEPLTELNNMIGMKELKKNIIYQILYFIQELHICTFEMSNDVNKISNEYMHTVIYGNPGTGKTEVAKIIGNIFSKLGLLSKGTFKKVTRSDLIAGYVGQTALKTKEVIKDSLGGVLFIDEAYSLGNSEKKDTFSKECIDTICEALSDYKENLMVIIAGYENELNECFFNYNQGLNSRFAWRFKMDDYSGEDLYKIFVKKVHMYNWEVTHDITSLWFDKNIGHFRFFGRDIENLLAKTKIVHSKRVFCKNIVEKKKIKLEDLENGLTMYLNNNDTKNNKETDYVKKQLQYSMYN
jgi:SpoVK/Ycf46/Vps4 family AAA+-type ATPase